MTPAVRALKKQKIPHRIHEYDHKPSEQGYGAEAVEKLGLNEAQVFKTLVVTFSTNEMAVGIIPVSSKLNLKLMAKAADKKKAKMSEPADVERSTGYVLGGVSPLGQKKKLNTYIDASAEKHQTIFVSAGRRGLEIELAPNDLKKLTNGQFALLSQ